MRRRLIEFPFTDEDLGKIFGPSNEVTIQSWDQRWLDNVKRNLELFPDPHNAQRLVYDEPNYHTVLVCGAGWTLTKLAPYASKIPKSWGIICADRALSYLLRLGLEPSLVVTMDGDQTEQPLMQEAFTRLKGYPNVPVLVDLVACPTIVSQLKKPYFFRSACDPKVMAMQYLADWQKTGNKELSMLGHGGNVGSVCTIASKFFMFAKHVVLLGFNFSMCEGTRNTDTWERVPLSETAHQYLDVCDIYGRPVRTIANLHNYRVWQESFCHSNDDVEWINANDGGYLGVHDPLTNYSHYTYESLGHAIERLGDHGLEEH